MGTLETHLRQRRDSGRKLLLPYVTGGITDDWLDVIRAYDAEGADAVEVGIPFSDPVMDGPTIQAASDASLARGTTPVSILSDLRSLDDVSIPIVVMTYANIPFHMGFARFAAECVEAGVAGAILPDIPLEETGPWNEAVGDLDLDTVMLASPISSDERLAALAGASRGFVYGVNVLGVTGERADVGEWTADLAGRLKQVTDLPVVMGFGISSPETAAAAAVPSDGVIVASALMRLLLDGGSALDAGRFTAQLRAALDDVSA